MDIPAICVKSLGNVLPHFTHQTNIYSLLYNFGWPYSYILGQFKLMKFNSLYNDISILYIIDIMLVYKTKDLYTNDYQY